MIFKSPYPDIRILELPVADYVMNRAGQKGDKPALIDGPSGRTITFSQMAEQVPAVAAGLNNRGFREGDVFAVCTPNVPDFATIFLAVTSLGGVVTTANPDYRADRMAAQFEDAGARFLLTTPTFMDKASAAASRAGIEEIFVLGEAPGATPFASLLQSKGRPPRVAINPRKDVAALHYSSGTTGAPKGVMLTHTNIVANLAQIVNAEDIGQEDILFCAPPFFHVFGMMVMLTAIRSGATLVTIPIFEPEHFLQTLQTHAPNRLFAAPPLVQFLAYHPLVEGFDLSNVTHILSSGAALNPAIGRDCAERLNCQVKQGFGMTEALATHMPPDSEARRKATSVGLPLANTECKVVDIDSGRELGPNQKGEIWLRGPQVMRGYLNRDEVTRETIGADGWLRTGDLGFIDEEGYLTIGDRISDLIGYNGFRVAPTELETVLLSHPAVADTAVVALPDASSGQVARAFVVRKGDASAEELIAYVAGQVSDYKRIRQVEFVDEIPKTPAGKVLRRLLAEREVSSFVKI